jgi:hypothetical protein
MNSSETYGMPNNPNLINHQNYWNNTLISDLEQPSTKSRYRKNSNRGQ